LGSTDPYDYKEKPMESTCFGDGKSHIANSGEGTIDVGDKELAMKVDSLFPYWKNRLANPYNFRKKDRAKYCDPQLIEW